MDLAHIHQAIAAGRFRVTDHADEEMAADALTLDEVLQSVLGGEVIEDYPTDHRCPVV